MKFRCTSEADFKQGFFIAGLFSRRISSLGISLFRFSRKMSVRASKKGMIEFSQRKREILIADMSCQQKYPNSEACCDKGGSMKALLMRKPGDVVLEDYPTPVPDKNQVLVRIHAAGICVNDIRDYKGECYFCHHGLENICPDFKQSIAYKNPDGVSGFFGFAQYIAADTYKVVLRKGEIGQVQRSAVSSGRQEFRAVFFSAQKSSLRRVFSNISAALRAAFPVTLPGPFRESFRQLSASPDTMKK